MITGGLRGRSHSFRFKDSIRIVVKFEAVMPFRMNYGTESTGPYSDTGSNVVIQRSAFEPSSNPSLSQAGKGNKPFKHVSAKRGISMNDLLLTLGENGTIFAR
jgi:hypothetical protein